MSNFVGDIISRNEQANPQQIERLIFETDRLAVIHYTDRPPYLPDIDDYWVYSAEKGFYQQQDMTRFSLWRSRHETGSAEDPSITESWNIHIYLPPEKQRNIGGLALGRSVSLDIMKVTESRLQFDSRNYVEDGLEKMNRFGIESPPGSSIEGSLAVVASHTPDMPHMRMSTKLEVYDKDGYIDRSDDASAFLQEARNARATGDNDGADWATLRGLNAKAEPFGAREARQTLVTQRQARRFALMLTKLSPENVLENSPLNRP